MKSKTDPVDVIRGGLPLVFITLNLAFWILPLVLLALLKLVIPVPHIRNRIYQLMLVIYNAACKIDLFLFQRILGIQFVFNIEQKLEKDRNHLIISNHQSWADILVFQSLLIHQAPIIKFIVKQELLYLPLIGLICWAYEYPMVQRQSFKKGPVPKSKPQNDLKTLKRKLEGIRYHPASIINFAEGTRFNREKRDKHGSPHKHLLKARTGGLFFILDIFGDMIDDVLDVTISYSCKEPIFFKFLGGKEKTITVQATRINLNDLLPELSDKTGKLVFDKVEDWLTRLWLKKDQQLDLLNRD